MLTLDICRYYLACLGQVDMGVSVPAGGNHDNLDYGELNALPENAEHLQQNANYQRLIGKIRADRSRLSMFLGYPTCLKIHQNSWKIEPLLLFPIEIDENQPHIDTEHPIINQKPLSLFTNAEHGEAFTNELVQLRQDLGIGGQEGVDVGALAREMEHIRNEWPWKENINPDILGNEPNLYEINQEGIYNRAVLIIAERSPFTQGLEGELAELATKDDTAGTALGQWLEIGSGAERQTEEMPPLLEVFSMNPEQRKAIHSALTRPLTIITGPPGTGKSQVVTNLLVNAAYQGKCVLFSSKNHKAVDVVEERINGLVPHSPILLKLGKNSPQEDLMDYLQRLLTTDNQNDDVVLYKKALNKREELQGEINLLDKEIKNIIEYGNITDELEKDVEGLRVANEQLFESLKSSDMLYWEKHADAFRMTIERASVRNRGFFIRMAWPLYKYLYFWIATPKIKITIKLAKQLCMNTKIPDEPFNEKHLEQWNNFSKLLENRIYKAKSIKKYYDALEKLQSCQPLEDVLSEQGKCFNKIIRESKTIWELWIRSQRIKTKSFNRKALVSYVGQIRRSIDNRQNSLKCYRNVSRFLPCWAVTSLSARGRLPFEAGFFDLIVFDEASQCDIASALPLLYRAKSVVVIGDFKQLSHISGLNKQTDEYLRRIYNIDNIEDDNWSYSENSLLHLALSQVSGDGIVNLLEHHRSHADIIGFSNKHFYEEKLRIATRYNDLTLISHDKLGVRWKDAEGEVAKPRAGGAFNQKEVCEVVKALDELILQNNYQGSIGVVSPFRAQANAIRVAVKNNAQLEAALRNKDFLVDTVHKFQGDERDVIIFSPVLSQGMTDGTIRFLKNNENLFNVAITRAKAQLIVVGDREACRNCDVGYLREFALYSQQLEQREIETIPVSRDYEATYPAVSNPEQVSEWEKFFYAELYKTGIKTLPQYRVDQYALDLAIVNGNKKLNIEVDGEMYHRNWTGELCRRDQTRNQRLKELGWDVMRFWVYEIRDDLPSCIAKVKQWQN